MAYASKYYDPVKAHEYYMKHRKLKCRRSTKGFTEQQKAMWTYGKDQIKADEKAEKTQASADSKERKALISQQAKEQREAISADAKEKRQAIAEKAKAAPPFSITEA